MTDALLGIRPGEGLCIARNKRRLIGVMTADRLRDAALADALDEPNHLAQKDGLPAERSHRVENSLHRCEHSQT
ncbi:hypothetical protein [Aureimonas jatrophae]|uniref:Uncharacterized protein n=1 Tax=Aureimonas jatrophae TaxID=1166073 RepID=A0A1H0MIF9_9HYPH|nr:hypothetical protein [Aureimonas jatrophae]MBB3952944.1 hypothetical protein [Aureimonas jatrophae]SDO80167.1 hypothetical protein SAMN05192530_11413 [Aureimonas jatrophae]